MVNTSQHNHTLMTSTHTQTTTFYRVETLPATRAPPPLSLLAYLLPAILGTAITCIAILWIQLHRQKADRQANIQEVLPPRYSVQCKF